MRISQRAAVEKQQNSSFTFIFHQTTEQNACNFTPLHPSPSAQMHNACFAFGPYSNSTNTSSTATSSSGLQLTALTVTSLSQRRIFCIFIASITATSEPAASCNGGEAKMRNPQPRKGVTKRMMWRTSKIRMSDYEPTLSPGETLIEITFPGMGEINAFDVSTAFFSGINCSKCAV